MKIAFCTVSDRFAMKKKPLWTMNMMAPLSSFQRLIFVFASSFRATSRVTSLPAGFWCPPINYWV